MQPPNLRGPNATRALFNTSAGRWLALVAFFSLASVVQTWPLVLHATDHIMGWAPDSYESMWTLWWVKHALVDLQTNPFHSDLLFYPQGTDLYLHTLIFTNGVLSTPLQVATGNVILSWNVLALVLLVLSGLGGYALSYRITGNHWAAVLSGYIFAFCPFTLTAIHGHLNISTTWPIPLFALLLLRFHENGRLREMAALGVLWAVMTYNWFEFAVDAGILLLLFVTFYSFMHLRDGDTAKSRALLRGTVLATGVWLAVSAPLLIPSVLSALSGDISNRGGLSPPPEFYSADLLGYVTPSPLWGPGQFSNGEVPGEIHAAVGGVEGTVFLGFIPLLLAGLAVPLNWKSPQKRTMLFWAGTFVFFAVMAVGPFLYVGGEKEISIGGVSLSLSLPFRAFAHLPIVGLRRVPARMIVFGMLSLSVLAGMGLASLMPRLRRAHAGAAPLLGIVALALVVLEFWNPPVSLNHFTTPHVYEEIGAEEGDFAVLDLPVGRITGVIQRGDVIGAALAEYAQTIHGKAIIGGYISRAKDRDIQWLGEEPGLDYLSCPTCPGAPEARARDPATARDVFDRLQIKYVILHKVDLEGHLMSYEIAGTTADVQEYLESSLGLTLVVADQDIIVYRNDDVR